MSSASLSQNPQLMLPHSLAEKIDFPNGLKPAERRWLSDDVIKEFRKTAKITGSEPWRLFEAQQWLQTLRDENESKVTKQPPQLQMVLELGATADVGELPDYSDLFIPDDPAPRRVQVALRKGMKRPAAARPPHVLKRPCMRRPAASDHEAPVPEVQAEPAESEAVLDGDQGEAAEEAPAAPERAAA